MNAPILSFRNRTSPYAAVTQPFTYSQTVARHSGLPVLEGEKSDVFYFRLYNNFSTPPASSIATAYNCLITTFDGQGAVSRTATTLPVSQTWIAFYENGFGEQSSVPGLFTFYQDTEQFVGGSGNTYAFSNGSDGSANAYIRAYSNNAGVGFIEFATYAKVPASAPNQTFLFAISVIYDWNT